MNEEESADALSNTDVTQQLCIIDKSLGFLLLIIAAVLLSFYSVAIQRKQLEYGACGETECLAALPPIYPMKLTAGAIVVGALGFFLQLAQQTLAQAQCQGDADARHSASMNVWAAIFVMAAALIRFYDIACAEHRRRNLLEEDTFLD